MVGRFLALVFTIFLVKSAAAACCKRAREPCVAPAACACAGELQVSGAVSCGACGPRSEALCACGASTCSGCYRDAAAPCACNTCNTFRSPVCDCLSRLDDGSSCRDGCSCRDVRSCRDGCGCAAKTYIYFPEVVYPQTCLEMNPFYFTNCWNY